MKHIFMFSILFKSHLFRHSRMGRAFKDTQRALEHLRHSENTNTLEYLESIQRTHRALRHLDTWALKAFRHLDTRALKELGYLDTWAFGTLYIADSLEMYLYSSKLSLIISKGGANSALLNTLGFLLLKVKIA